MTRAEVDALLEREGINICARFYQRADGTVITADCPIGRRIKRRMRLLALFFIGFCSLAAFTSRNARPGNTGLDLQNQAEIKLEYSNFVGGIAYAPPPARKVP